MKNANEEESINQIVELLGCKESDIIKISAKKGHGKSLRRHTMTSILKRNTGMFRPPGSLYANYIGGSD